MDGLIESSIALPLLAGGLLLMPWPRRLAEAGGLRLRLYVGMTLSLSVALSLGAAWTGERSALLFTLLDGLQVYFRVDGLGRLFVTVTCIVWVTATPFSLAYMRGDRRERCYYGWWLLLYAVLMGLDFAGNMVTMYLFYELVTLTSLPLVLHGRTREGVMAGLKYLFYSMAGAYAGLFGIYFLHRYCGLKEFVAGGTLDQAAAGGQEGILLVAAFAMVVGFGAKAGMLPLHAWLPTAHPVAPSPASAVLSGVIVKAGVLALARAVFYCIGPDFLRGTWVQQAWMGLSLATVFMGSLLAYREQGFKKRLAYSTVSQVSYILFGLALLEPEAFKGAMFQVAVHAFAKCGLFLLSGVFLHSFGYTRVGQLAGMGRRRPAEMWCCLLLSLALVGIPPTGGFLGKWYLAQGALGSGAGVFSWLGPVVLLVSALLTAGYLLPIAMEGFFPGSGAKLGGSREGMAETDVLEGMAADGAEPVGGGGGIPEGEPTWERLCMLLPSVVLAALVLLLGIWPGPVLEFLSRLALETAG